MFNMTESPLDGKLCLVPKKIMLNKIQIFVQLVILRLLICIFSEYAFLP